MSDDKKMDVAKRWDRRIADAYEAGLTPTYDDLEEAVCELMNETRRLNGVITSMGQDVAKMITPRLIGQNDDCVLAAIDQFIARRAIIKPATEHAH